MHAKQHVQRFGTISNSAADTSFLQCNVLRLFCRQMFPIANCATIIPHMKSSVGVYDDTYISQIAIYVYITIYFYCKFNLICSFICLLNTLGSGCSTRRTKHQAVLHGIFGRRGIKRGGESCLSRRGVREYTCPHVYANMAGGR